jgi:hypothetical protein
MISLEGWDFMNDLNTEGEKNFLDFSNEERMILLQKNYCFLNNELIDWNKVNKKIKISLKEKGKKIGLDSMKMKISQGNKLVIQPMIFSRNFDELLIELKKNEKNELNSKIIDIAIKNGLLISEISKNQMKVKLTIEDEKLSINLDQNIGFFLGRIILDIDTFLMIIKENSSNNENFRKVKRLQLQCLYNKNIENKILLDILIGFVKNKVIEMHPFENYLQSKIEEIRKEIEVDIPSNDFEALEKLLMIRTDILFDKQGHARKHRK